MPGAAQIHVVAAVIENAQRQVLIAKRPEHVHQGGLWEFPGGKSEVGESAYDALVRECHEELNIDITQAEPLIQISHRYPDKHVLLDVWKVMDFNGEAEGAEQQPIRWVARDMLAEYDFPAANRAIIKAAQLPREYLITPEPEDEQQFLPLLEQALASGIRLVQFRAHQLNDKSYWRIAEAVTQLCESFSARLLFNRDVIVEKYAGHGRHLSATQLHKYTQRPISENALLGASCHNATDIQQAAVMDADFVVLSPVNVTASHPDAQPLGWDEFSRLCAEASLPVYALGGMQALDMDRAVSCGAQGIAAISGLWPD